MLALVSVGHLPHVGPGLVFADVTVQEWPRFITGHGLDFATRAVEIGVLPPDTPGSILFKIWYELGVLGAIAFAVLAVSAFIAAGNAPLAIAPALLADLSPVLSSRSGAPKRRKSGGCRSMGSMPSRLR